MTYGILLFVALFAVRVIFWAIRRSEHSVGPDPHDARALEDSFKDNKKRRPSRGRPPADGRQIAGEECAECESTIIAETEATACADCDALLHRKGCARRHACKRAGESAGAA